MIVINTMNLKPGSIIIRKSHNILKELFYTICGKELPFNKIEIATNSNSSAIYVDNEQLVFLVPKKAYSKNEIKMLTNIISSKTLDISKLKDIVEIVNEIRPNTLPENATIKDIINSSYYKNADVEGNSFKICD